MLNRDDAVLVFIDVQGRLHELMDGKETLDANMGKLIQCAQLLEVPILGTEQIPEKLGPTNEPFKTLLDGVPMIGKSAFSCYGEPEFVENFQALEKKQVILIGIEAHICVYQTAIDLLELGMEVFVAADAVSSRMLENKTLALESMRNAGAVVLPAESILMALLRDAKDPAFRELLKLIK
ncbi:isochorismatase family protein [Pontiellaceae bacterium B12227]|nr:isochorismatase family protein [Pontiellaceae bacterium B12227]